MTDKAVEYLKVLELEPGASFQDVKEAYKFQSMAWHPDRFSNMVQKEKAEYKQKRINVAFQWLNSNKDTLPRLVNAKRESSSKQSTRSSAKSTYQPPPPQNYSRNATRSSTNNAKNQRRSKEYYRYGPYSYDIDTIERAKLDIQSKKHIRRLGLYLYLFIIFFVIIAEWYNFENTFIVPRDLGNLHEITIGFISMIGLFMFFFKDIYKIKIFLINDTEIELFSYKAMPFSSKTKASKKEVDKINEMISARRKAT